MQAFTAQLVFFLLCLCGTDPSETTSGHYIGGVLALEARMQAHSAQLVCLRLFCLGMYPTFKSGNSAGHSMGGALASVAAGSHADAVSTAFLMDPVDWDYASNRVSATYLPR